MKPRDWQGDVLKQFKEHTQQSFVIEGPTGAGKTEAALTCRRWWAGQQSGKPLTIIVAPNVGVLRKWLAEVAYLGRTGVRSLDLDDRAVKTAVGERKLERIDIAPPSDLMFWGMTYQGIEVCQDVVRETAVQRPTIVIPDELHRLESSEHTSWGPACEYAFAPAGRIIGLSATPFRTRGRVSFLNEGPNGDVEPDYRLPRRKALDDEYICPLGFSLWGAHMGWQRRSRADGRVIVFEGEISDPRRADEALSRALKDPDFQDDMIDEGVRALDHIRRRYPPATGIIVCDRQEDAKALVGRVQRKGRSAVAVISEKADSQVVMDALRDGRRDDDFMVTVGMAREGCDIPRLKVIIWLSAVKTLVGFIQTTGRVVRWVDVPGLEAVCVLPEHPLLTEYAKTLLDLQTPGEEESAGPEGGEPPERQWDDDDQWSENRRPTATIDGQGEKHELESMVFALAKKHGVPVHVAEAMLRDYEDRDNPVEELAAGDGETPRPEDPGRVRDQVAGLVRRIARHAKIETGRIVNEIKREATGRVAKLENYDYSELIRLRALMNHRCVEEGW